MSQLEKLIQKMRRLPPEMSYEEVAKVLAAYSWFEVRCKGSHHVYRHPDGGTMTIPTKGGKMVKTTYLKEVLKRIAGE